MRGFLAVLGVLFLYAVARVGGWPCACLAALAMGYGAVFGPYFFEGR